METTEVPVPTKQLLRHHQREDYKGEIESMETMLPQLKSQQDRGDVQRRLGRLKQSLLTQSPVELPGSAKDKLVIESRRLEESFRHGMVSKEEMRKNPTGTVGQHMKWEAANKKDILRWKNIQQMIDPESQDPDLSNVEKLRPSGTEDRLRTDAQIGGHMTFGRIPQEKWNQAFEGKGPVNTALEQAKRVQEEIKKPHMTMEQKERAKINLAKAREKMKEMRAAQALTIATAQMQVTTPTPTTPSTESEA